MQIIFQTLLFSATLADYLTANYTCDCSFHAEETECTNTGICFWVNKACQKLDCSDIDEGSCDFSGGCSLNNDNKCENTQACSTYTVNKQTDCMYLKGNCAPQSIENDTTQYQCSTYTMADCSAQDNTTCNYSYQNGSSLCIKEFNHIFYRQLIMLIFQNNFSYQTFFSTGTLLNITIDEIECYYYTLFKQKS